MGAAFEEYREVPETVPLNFTQDDVSWVTLKISGAAGMLGAEVIGAEKMVPSLWVHIGGANGHFQQTV